MVTCPVKVNGAGCCKVMVFDTWGRFALGIDYPSALRNYQTVITASRATSSEDELKKLVHILVYGLKRLGRMMILERSTKSSSVNKNKLH